MNVYVVLRLIGASTLTVLLASGCGTSSPSRTQRPMLTSIIPSSQMMDSKQRSDSAALTTLYRSEQYRYSVLYDSNWQVSEGYGVTLFRLSADGPGFTIHVNDEVGGVPSVAYYAVLRDQRLRP